LTLVSQAWHPADARAYPDGEERALTQKLSGRFTLSGKDPKSVDATFFMVPTSKQRFVGYLVTQLDDAPVVFSTTIEGDAGQSLELKATQRQGWMPPSTSAAHLDGTCTRDPKLENIQCKGNVSVAGKPREYSIILFGGREAEKIQVSYPGKLAFDDAPKAQQDAELLLVHDKRTKMHGIVLIDTEHKTHVFDSSFHIVKQAAIYSLAGKTERGDELRAKCTQLDDGTTVCNGSLYQKADQRALQIVFYGGQ
jgi:hypothetical protein